MRRAEVCTVVPLHRFLAKSDQAPGPGHAGVPTQQIELEPHTIISCLPRIHNLPVASMTIKFTLFSIDEDLVDQWRQSFFAIVPDKVRDRVSFVHTSLQQSNTIFDCLVSPANSFGRFDGGYGLATTALMYS